MVISDPAAGHGRRRSARWPVSAGSPTSSWCWRRTASTPAHLESRFLPTCRCGLRRRPQRCGRAAEGELVLEMDDDELVLTDFVGRTCARPGIPAGRPGRARQRIVYYLKQPRPDLRLRAPRRGLQGLRRRRHDADRRAALLELGGFPSLPRHVDKGLTAKVRDAGGTYWPAHGSATSCVVAHPGAPSDADLDDLITRAVNLAGFPSGRLVELTLFRLSSASHAAARP